MKTISLEELVELGALLRRFERKYVLPAAALPELFDALPADTRILDIGGRRRFPYRSTYFDTPGLDSYLGAAHRRRRRFKLRVRSYLGTGEDFLEVKTRGPRGVTIKDRFPYEGEHHRLTPAAQTLASGVLAAARIVPGGAFGPALISRYERTTLFVPGSASRVTIDHDLTWALPGTPEPVPLPGRVVVETKSPRLTSPVDRLLWSLAHRPTPISKYATGLAVLRPGLPANRWRPVLRRHLTPESPA
ncbi:VTC domain-containing protein [Paractinoplanes deccanensis]|uniref:VTC domain-containing protein n=1 Tax=Paractinoplanes deccanensis TaxID=113561 RepID=A0ABQ3Y406_9ACTN|nr:polyphosphate polymerase domain-containing protein [Actinoplanes deccanensis]GID74734.1 VTC domain-containing protein [Actinoplanes deccanensis]